METSKKYLELKEELRKLTNVLESQFDGHERFLYKINGNLYFSKFIYINDRTGKPYLPLTRNDIRGYRSVLDPKLNIDEYKAVKKIEIERFTNVLDYIQDKIRLIEENEELTVKEQRDKLEFWGNLQRTIGNECPHKFNSSDYCEICGESLIK